MRQVNKTHSKLNMKFKTVNSLSGAKLNSGFTIIELLVGLAISTFIIGVTLTYLVSSVQSFRLQSNEDMVQENARFALELMSRNIRMAGLDPQDLGNVQSLNVIYQDLRCPAAGVSAGVAGPNTFNCTGDGIGINGSDRFAIDYIVGGSSVGILKRTCNNETPADGSHIASVFWVAQSNAINGMNSLYCQAYNVDTGANIGNGVPILDGVDSLQIQYGVDTDNDGKVNSYQSYTNFNADANTDAQDIRSVRVALLLNSGISVSSTQNTEARIQRNYSLLDGVNVGFNDGVMRQIFSTTVMLPNGL